MVFMIAVLMLVMLLTMKFEFKTLPNTKDVLQKELDSLGKMNRGEINSLIVFSVCFILSFARPLFQNSLPTLTPTRVFFIGALISFLLPGSGCSLFQFRFHFCSIWIILNVNRDFTVSKPRFFPGVS